MVKSFSLRSPHHDTPTVNIANLTEMTAPTFAHAAHRLACGAFLQLLYGWPLLSISRLYTLAADNLPMWSAPYRRCLMGEISMSVMDGISLLMGVGLFIYLLVALLRADQSQE
nr:K(+)-transporting ATPase subunit F [Pseudomonas syringae]